MKPISKSGQPTDILDALSSLEMELIALKDVVDIIDKIPLECATLPYLVRRVKVHTAQLDVLFRQAWRTAFAHKTGL